MANRRGRDQPALSDHVKRVRFSGGRKTARSETLAHEQRRLTAATSPLRTGHRVLPRASDRRARPQRRRLRRAAVANASGPGSNEQRLGGDTEARCTAARRSPATASVPAALDGWPGEPERHLQLRRAMRRARSRSSRARSPRTARERVPAPETRRRSPPHRRERLARARRGPDHRAAPTLQRRR